MAELPPRAAPLVFDRHYHDATLFNLTNTQAEALGWTLLCVATADFLATAFLMALTYVTTAMDGMKMCEKLLIYNVLVPDLILEALLFFFYGPDTLANKWQHGTTDTVLLAFLHTYSIFHAQVAIAIICHVIAISMTDAYRFEMANDMKHMSVVVICTVSVSICFCSLPATEDFGYTVTRNWLGASFNVKFEYGSIFMCSALMALVLSYEALSIFRLLEARKFFHEHRARITTQSLQDLDKDIIFCLIASVSTCLVIPIIIGVPDPVLMFLFRLLVYGLPILRVMVLITTCPHFNFAFFAEEDEAQFAELEALDVEDMDDDERPLATHAQPNTVLEETMSGIHVVTEL